MSIFWLWETVLLGELSKNELKSWKCQINSVFCFPRPFHVHKCLSLRNNMFPAPGSELTQKWKLPPDEDEVAFLVFSHTQRWKFALKWKFSCKKVKVTSWWGLRCTLLHFEHLIFPNFALHLGQVWSSEDLQNVELELGSLDFFFGKAYTCYLWSKSAQ